MSSQALTESSRILLVCAILFIDFLGLGLVIPVMPAIVAELTGMTVPRAATIAGWLIFTYGIAQLLCAPFVGSLSDRFGRKPVLLAALVALGVNYGFMAAAPSLIWLFAGRAISGVAGATWPAAASCIADITDEGNRAKAMGKLSASSAAGYIFAPALGGALGQSDPRGPFWVACVITLTVAVIGAILLKETLPKEKMRPLTLSRSNPVGSFRSVTSNRKIFPILIAYMFLNLSIQSQISIWSFYGIEKFSWSYVDIGLTMAVFGITFVFVQVAAIGPVVRRIGEFRTSVVSIAIGVPTYLIIAFAENTSVAVFGIVVGSLTALAQPSLNSLMMKFIKSDSQGELQGAVASIASLSALIGAPVMAYVFSLFSSRQYIYLPGAPFVLASIFVVISVSTLLIARKSLAD